MRNILYALQSYICHTLSIYHFYIKIYPKSCKHVLYDLCYELPDGLFANRHLKTSGFILLFLPLLFWVLDNSSIFVGIYDSPRSSEVNARACGHNIVTDHSAMLK